MCFSFSNAAAVSLLFGFLILSFNAEFLDYNEIVSDFVDIYYHSVSLPDRAKKLKKFYDPIESHLTFRGFNYNGRDSILDILMSDDYPLYERSGRATNFQLLHDGLILITIVGRMIVDEAISQPFGQVFIIKLDKEVKQIRHEILLIGYGAELEENLELFLTTYSKIIHLSEPTTKREELSKFYDDDSLLDYQKIQYSKRELIVNKKLDIDRKYPHSIHDSAAQRLSNGRVLIVLMGQLKDEESNISIFHVMILQPEVSTLSSPAYFISNEIFRLIS